MGAPPLPPPPLLLGESRTMKQATLPTPLGLPGAISPGHAEQPRPQQRPHHQQQKQRQQQQQQRKQVPLPPTQQLATGVRTIAPSSTAGGGLEQELLQAHQSVQAQLDSVQARLSQTLQRPLP